MTAETKDAIEVETARVACDGGSKEAAASGHPKVWLDLGKDGAAECPYCGQRFVLKSGAAGH